MNQPNGNEEKLKDSKTKASLAVSFVLALLMARCTMTLFQAKSREIQAYDHNALSPEAAWIFEKPDHFILFSISAFAEMRRWVPGQANQPVIPSTREKFYEHEVLGKADITNRSEQVELYGAITNGLRELEGDRLHKFDPRYAVRIQRENKTVDLILSFECRIAEERLGAKRELTISSAPAEVFKHAFERHGPLLDTNDFFGIYAEEKFKK